MYHAGVALSIEAAAFPTRTRYIDLGELGRGVTGVVYRARDTWFEELVALKVLTMRGPTALRDLKREFRCAVDIVHPNLVRLLELEADRTHRFFTMELVEGRPFTAWSRENGRDLRSGARQLLHGVGALHREGLVHRDLKPSNVLVDASERVVVLDFGFTVSASRPAVDGPAGTPRYLAPEVLRGWAHTAASDLYAIGLMLCEAMGATIPEARDWLELLDWKRRRALGKRPSRADPSLADLAWRLIDSEPDRRPTLAEALAVLSGDPATTGHGGSPPFVGRGQELGALATALARVVQTRSGMVVELRGEAGTGKTRVVGEFLRTLGPHVAVLACRCHPNERVAYGGLDRVVHELDQLLAVHPRVDLSGVEAALFHVFPALRPAAECELPLGDDPTELLRSAIAALRGLFARISRPDAPLVLWIDDAQWIGEDGARLLRDVLAQPNDLCVFTVLGTRAREIEAMSPALASLIDTTVDISPLAAVDASALLASFSLAAEVGARIVQESAGNLHVLLTLARACAADPGCADRTYALVLAEQLENLPEEPRRLLDRLAVAGRPVRPDELPPGEPRRGVRTLERLGLIRSEGADRGFVPSHEHVRKHVLARLAPPDLRRIHLALADDMIARGGSPELVVVHLRAAGEAERAYPLACQAAEAATKALAFGQAATLHGDAFELAPPNARPERRRELASALSRAGLGAAAAQHFLALAHDAGPIEAALLEQQAAEQLLFAGHQAAGIKVLRSALARLKEPFPRSRALAFVRLMLRALRLRPGRTPCEVQPERTWTSDRLRRIDALHTASLGLSMSEAILSSALGLRHLDAALALGEPARLARALAIQMAQLAAFRYDPAKTQALFEQAFALAEQAKSEESKALVRIAAATAAWMEGRFEACHWLATSIGSALASEAPGLRFHRDSAEIVRLGGLLHTGRWRELVTQVPETLMDAARRGDLYLTVNVKVRYGGWRWLARDEPESGTAEIAEGQRAWPRAGFDLTDVFAVHGTATCLLYSGQTDAANACLKDALPHMRRSFLLSVGFLRTLVLDLRARAMLAQALAHGVRPPLRTLHWLWLLLSRIGSPFAEMCATRLAAELAVLDGDAARAEYLLQRSAAGSEVLGMRLEAAAAQARLADLKGSQAAVEVALARIHGVGVRNPRRLARLYFPTFR